MPQIVLEHSANVAPGNALKEVMQRIHQIISTTGAISIDNCKSRCYCADNFLVGNGDPDNAFVHLDVRFVEGRTLEVRQAIGEQLKRCLTEYFLPANGNKKLQITVEVRDIVLDEYFKYPEGTLTHQNR